MDYGTGGKQATRNLRELILLLCNRFKDDADFTVPKLWALCWLIDSRVYAKTGKSFTGCVYIKKRCGIVPKYGNRVLRQMVKRGTITTEVKQ